MSINDISATIHNALAAAGLNPASPRLQQVGETIRRALAAAGLASPPSRGATAERPARTPFADMPLAPRADVDVAVDVDVDTPAGRAPVAPNVGEFTEHHCTVGSVSRAYKLYVPSSYRGAPLPLLVMLHGCKQNPDDFARGTRMNELAEAHGLLVAYPAQTVRANGANCWNWFERAEQRRGGDEPAVLAGIARDVAAHARVDADRVFVAGLSAGAAMAVILGATYPEVFRAVAAHSGLPRGAAHDVASAFRAMQGQRVAGAVEAAMAAAPARPLIVFHGDADTTVAASNGEAIVARAAAAFEHASGAALQPETLALLAGNGRDCSVTRYLDAAGRSRIEAWVVKGGAHAWFGGSAAGSYTDAKGPDASAEIVRFFLEQ